jgi:hypothetical protein
MRCAARVKDLSQKKENQHLTEFLEPFKERERKRSALLGVHVL